MAVVALLFTFVRFAIPAVADEKEDRRITAGLDLFPSVLAADSELSQKRDGDGNLLVLILYHDKKETATRMADKLSNIERIRSIPLRVEIAGAESLTKYQNGSVAGIFITQRLDAMLAPVVQFGVDKRVIVFSPFEGDVQKGVSAGIEVREQILPYVNISALQKANIKIKKFFLEIAERYE